MIFEVRGAGRVQSIDVPFEFPGSLFDIVFRNNEHSIELPYYPGLDPEVLDRYFDFWRVHNRTQYRKARRKFADLIKGGLDLQLTIRTLDYLGIPTYPLRLAIAKSDRVIHFDYTDPGHVTIALDRFTVLYRDLVIYNSPQDLVSAGPLMAIRLKGPIPRFAVVESASLAQPTTIVDCTQDNEADIYLFYNGPRAGGKISSRCVNLTPLLEEMYVFVEGVPTYAVHHNAHVVYFREGADIFGILFGPELKIYHIPPGEEYTEVTPEISVRLMPLYDEDDMLDTDNAEVQIVTTATQILDTTSHDLYVLNGSRTVASSLEWAVEDLVKFEV